PPGADSRTDRGLAVRRRNEERHACRGRARRPGRTLLQGRARLGRLVAVDVRLAGPEADLLVEGIGGLARRPRGQVDGANAGLGCEPDGVLHERLASALTARGLVHHDVLDPGAGAGRRPKDDERERADDRDVVVSGHEDGGGGRGNNLLEVLTRGY